MNLILDFDDLHWKHPQNCIDSIEYLVTRCSDIKMIFFTVPYLDNLDIGHSKEFCDAIRFYINKGNIKLAIHGTTHSMLEYENKDYDDAISSITLSETIMEKAELPYLKIFKGPNWGINSKVINACIDKGYTHIFNHDNYKHLDNAFIKFIYYNWNLKDNLNITTDIIYGHGHTHNVCDNGIKEVRDRILKTIELNKLICTYP